MHSANTENIRPQQSIVKMLFQNVRMTPEKDPDMQPPTP
jgi:hypothetical protein